MSRAVIYVRVSSREPAEGGYSIDAQLEACRRVAIEKGWTIEDEFTELGESARTADRTAFNAMTALLEPTLAEDAGESGRQQADG